MDTETVHGTRITPDSEAALAAWHDAIMGAVAVFEQIFDLQTSLQMRPPITVPPARIFKRFGDYYCRDCGFMVSPIKICNCQPAPPPSVAQDGADAASALEQRIKDAQKVR